MTAASGPALAIVAALAAWLWLFGLRAVGRVAAAFGEDPRWWQLRMAPFGVLAPLLTYLLLNRRNGGGGGLA